MAQKGALAYAQAKGAPAGFVLGLLALASRARASISATTSVSNLQDHYLNALTALVRITASSQGAFVSFSQAASKSPVRASQTLTSDNTAVADGDTVTIGSTVYRYKNTIAQAYDVHRTGTVDTDLGNLIKAINGTGTVGTDYFAGTAVHPTVFAGTTITSHAFTVYAKAFGTAGNSIATTETSAHLSWGSTTLASGADANFDDYIPAGATKEYTIDDSVTALSFIGDGGTSTVTVVEY